MRRVGQVETLEDLLGPFVSFCPGKVVQAPHHLEVLQAGEVLVDGRELTGEADHGTEEHRVANDVVARHHGLALIGFEQGREDADRGGLPRPVGSEETEDRALLHRQVHAFHGLHLPEGLLQTLGPDDRLFHGGRDYRRTRTSPSEQVMR